MVYNQVTTFMDTFQKMLKNGDDHKLMLNLFDISYPEVKKILLSHDIKECSSCSLYPCNHTPFEGDIHADIMIIGEAPGEHEEQQGRPFVGPSGQLLDAMLNAAVEKINPRWARENLFITNVIKCRPVDGTDKNRKPTIQEIVICKKFLDKEIELVKPKVIICAGTTAASTIIHPQFKVTEEHGNFFGDNMKMIAIYHPSYLLYQGLGTPESNQAKIDMWNDIIKINEYLDSLDGDS